jgi:hypothetical protein
MCWKNTDRPCTIRQTASQSPSAGCLIWLRPSHHRNFDLPRVLILDGAGGKVDEEQRPRCI